MLTTWFRSIRSVLVCAIVVIATRGMQASTLVSHWTGDGTALDVIGTNEGVINNAVNYTGGVIGQAFSFDGGYINVATPNLNSYAAAFSFATWIRFDAINAPASIFNFRNAANSRGFTLEHLFAQHGSLAFYLFKDSGGPVTLLSSSGWQTGVVYHLAATFNGQSMSIYRDGVLVASRTDAASPMAQVDSPYLQIGRNTFHGTMLDGMMDDVRFYSGALTPGEIALLINPAPEPSRSLLAAIGLFAALRRRGRKSARA